MMIERPNLFDLNNIRIKAKHGIAEFLYYEKYGSPSMQRTATEAADQRLKAYKEYESNPQFAVKVDTLTSYIMHIISKECEEPTK